MEISIDDKFVKVCSATDTISYKIICSWSDPKFLAIDPTTNALVEVIIIKGEGELERTVEIGNLDKSTSYRSTQIKQDTFKVVVPQLSDESLTRMKAAEEEQRIADSIAIANYTKKFVDSIPEKDLKLITGPNMNVEYAKPTPQKKSAPKMKPTSKKSN